MDFVGILRLVSGLLLLFIVPGTLFMRLFYPGTLMSAFRGNSHHKNVGHNTDALHSAILKHDYPQLIMPVVLLLIIGVSLCIGVMIGVVLGLLGIYNYATSLVAYGIVSVMMIGIYYILKMSGSNCQ